MRSKLARHSLTLAIVLATGATALPASASVYWDPVNATNPANAIWNTGTSAATNFNTAADGSGAQEAWPGSTTAVFSASTFTDDPYTVTVSGTNTASGIVVQSGTVTFEGTNTPILRLSGGGLIVSSTVTGPVTFNSPVSITGVNTSMAITNNSSQLVTFNSTFTTTKAGGTIATVGGGGSGGFTFSGAITDGGTNLFSMVINSATNTAFFDGAKTFTGGVTIKSGTALINNAASLGDESSAVTFNGTAPVLKLAADITTSRPITLTTAGTIDTGGFNLTYSGTTTGASTLTKNGNGALLVNGTISGPVTVSGGSLGGTNGTINGAATVQSTGTLAPGNSIGTLNFGSTLTLQGDAAFQISSDDSTADLAAGITTLTYGGSLHVSNLGDTNNFFASQTFNLFDASDVTADNYFDSVNLPNLPAGLTWEAFSGTGEHDQAFDYLTGQIVVQSSPVPEPASLALLGLGAAALLARRRKA